jgi:hypothetical protein
MGKWLWCEVVEKCHQLILVGKPYGVFGLLALVVEIEGLLRGDLNFLSCQEND